MEKPVLQKGRPADCTGRLEKEVRTYDFLDKLGISYMRVDHEAAENMEACAAIDEALAPAVICKNLFLCNAQKTKFYLLMIPGNKRFKTKELSQQISSSRLSFAEPGYMEKFLDITPGSVSVMGLMNDTDHRVQLLVDRDVMESGLLGCHPCINTSSMSFRTKDIFEKFVPATGHDYIIVDLTGE